MYIFIAIYTRDHYTVLFVNHSIFICWNKSNVFFFPICFSTLFRHITVKPKSDVPELERIIVNSIQSGHAVKKKKHKKWVLKK